MECLITCVTAREMWDKLLSIHEQKSACNLLHLNQKFHSYRMSIDDSISQHITKVENMARQLKDLNENISDNAIMAKILGSLPTKYNAVITAWNSVAIADQTL